MSSIRRIVNGAESRSVAYASDHSHWNAANPGLDTPATTVLGVHGETSHSPLSPGFLREEQQ
ncbi:uncharacterized protein N7503_005966 [Penicillium pulvis]|uniref:uncharacterized protein n=1 Tax=Penicillium pulvis TaxID=1562058 RepID=UPI002549A91F|nr:uncharacterized protein N7503_005966 [Penicillium pulvis]KAJ5803516.1 hypothetical protein N7503_005966 [Penicillium pulvis]